MGLVSKKADKAALGGAASTTDERAPLLQRSSSPTYTAPPQGPGAVLPVEDDGKEHFNLAGLSSGDFWVLISSLWMCSFLVAFDGTVVATLLGSISSSFYATNLASWLGTSYMLSVCCFTPIYGRLCNIIGRQASMLIALAIFGIGNLLCAVAPSMNFLIAARAIAGIGGGGVSTVSSTITSDLVPLHLRGIFQGLGNVNFGLGTGLGAALGGIINDRYGWRPAFGLQVPIFVIAGFAIFTKVRYTIPSDPKSGASTPSRRQTPAELFKRIDFLGCFLLAGWVGTALIAISLKTNSTAVDAYNWSSPTLLALFATSAVLFVIFLFVELKWAAEPVMPFELLHSRTPVSVAINNFLLSVVMFGCLYSVPLFFTAVRQMPSSAAGVRLFPNSLATMVGSLLSGFIVRHTGRYYWMTFWFSIFSIISGVWMCTWTTESANWQIWTAFFPMSLSLGAVTTLTIVGLIADLGREHIAIATSLSYVSRTLGQVLGVALSGAVLQAILQKELSGRITGKGAEELIASIRQSSASIKYLPPATKAAAIVSYEIALRGVFIIAAVGSVLFTIAGLGMRNVSFDSNGQIKKTPEEEAAEAPAS